MVPSSIARQALASFLAIAATLMPSGPVSADDVDKSIERSSVLVKAAADEVEKVTNSVGQVELTKTGVKKTNDKTAFFVSDDGLLLTTYSLIGGLGLIDPASIDFTVHMKNEGEWHSTDAVIVNVSHRLDMILLKATEQKVAYNSVKIGSIRHFNRDKKIRTGRLSFDHDMTTISGKVGNPCGTHSHLWNTQWGQTSMFADDEEGSPVYLEDGSVIGIGVNIEATSNDCEIGTFIPLHYADAILAPATLREFFRQFEELRSKITWHPGHHGRENGYGTAELSYRKLISPEPYPKFLTYKIKVYGEDADGGSFDRTLPNSYTEDIERQSSDDLSGQFSLRDVIEVADLYIKHMGIRKLKIEMTAITAVLSNQDKVERPSIIFDFSHLDDAEARPQE